MLKWCLSILFALAVFSSVYAAGESDTWLGAFDTMESANRHWELGEYIEAAEDYRQAREMFAALHRNYPEWRKDMVLFRWAYCGEKLTDCERRLSKPLAALSRKELEDEASRARERLTVLMKALRNLSGIKQQQEDLTQKYKQLKKENEQLKADKLTWTDKQDVVEKTLRENKRLRKELEAVQQENAKLKKLLPKREVKP